MRGTTLREVLRRYQDGAGVKTLAKWARTSPRTIRRWLREAGVQRHPVGGQISSKKISEKELRARYVQKREPIASIAASVGVSESVVRRWLVNAGVVIRRPGGRPSAEKGGRGADGAKE
jgi:transposase-like protein